MEHYKTEQLKLRINSELNNSLYSADICFNFIGFRACMTEARQFFCGGIKNS